MGIQDKLDIAFAGSITSKALMLAEHTGVFEHFDENNRVSETALRNHYQDRAAYIDAIIKSLREGDILEIKNGICHLLVEPDQIKKKLPIFKLWLHAYRELLGVQNQMFDGELNSIPYDGGSVAKHSAEIGAAFIDNQLEQVIEQLQLTHTLCDMGCGAGLRLIKLCRKFGLQGIGMDIDANAVNLANKNLADCAVQGVKFMQQDVTKITQKNTEIEAILFTFFTHHIEPNQQLEKLLNDYRYTFPNLKYMVIFDTVTAEDGNNMHNIFAKGFDYIHRLQGLIPRTRADYMSIFDNSHLHVVEEIPLAVDNSFVWVCQVN